MLRHNGHVGMAATILAVANVTPSTLSCPFQNLGSCLLGAHLDQSEKCDDLGIGKIERQTKWFARPAARNDKRVQFTGIHVKTEEHRKTRAAFPDPLSLGGQHVR